MSSLFRSTIAVAAIYAICCTNYEAECEQRTPPLHAAWYWDPACGGSCEAQCDSGWLSCAGDPSLGCDTARTDDTVLHQTIESTGHGCTPVCDPGWVDCDGNAANGCETSGYQCPHEGGGGGPHVGLPILYSPPNGLVACSGRVYVFGGPVLVSFDPVSLVNAWEAQTDGTPEGLACAGTNLYWTTTSTATSGAPNGTLWRLAIGTHTPAALATGIDPGRGIDVRDSNVYWIARSGPSDAGSVLAITSDAGTFAVMPTMETSAYKSFALASDGDYGISANVIYRSAWDGGVSVCVGDAGGSSSLLAVEGGLAATAGDGNTGTFDLVDTDGGSLETLSTVEPIVASASGGSFVVLASDATVYHVSLPSGTTTVLATNQLHVADVTIDSTYAYWTTRGTATVPSAVSRATLPSVADAGEADAPGD